ncbi:HAMP domain-containing protein [Cohnella sp. CFH 77786]|uniref:methyl-accepting chemotaxis protein n=1 Tax=Cohnella sp. CFH 77786 TaxID=2662265 RepID=UPI001EC83CED|nr:methyl-accepting chemotaxis protein [Cohnella sp. CFH 77786]MBW5449310.1 HAMP domain-containing protein [Cohnella sp. CFH 77786]
MNLFKNLKLYYKIFTLIVLALLMLISVAVIGYNYINKVADNGDNLYKNNMQIVDSLQTIRNSMRANIANFMEIIVSNDANKMKDLSEQIKARGPKVQQQFARLDALTMQPRNKALYPKFQEQYAAYSKLRDEGIALALKGKNEEAYGLFLNKTDALMRQTLDTIDQMVANANETAGVINGDNKKAASTAVTIMIIAALIAASLLTVIGIAITNLITRPVKKLQALMGRAEKGDLTVQGDYNAKDEIGQLNASFNAMLTGFKDTVDKVLSAAESVSASSQQISASTEEIASGSNDQAKSAQTMSELFKELSEAIASVAQSAEQASDMSNRTTEIAREGGKVVNASIRSMDRLNEQMSKLENDSNKIGEIIEVIDDIAEQTNLLALNAAIEAARAGDQGRGFAVVADEVRKLAERSGEATKQITAIIKGMQTNTKESVKAVGDGVETSQKMGEAFENIVSMVNESGLKVSEIAAASEQQAAQTSEVLQAIETISAATEESAASSEETAAAAQSLAQLAEDLNRTVSVFKIH